MTQVPIVDVRAEYLRIVLEYQRSSIRALLYRVSALRNTVPRGEGSWRSPAQRRYAERLRDLEDVLESAASELQGALAATGTALARIERLS